MALRSTAAKGGESNELGSLRENGGHGDFAVDGVLSGMAILVAKLRSGWDIKKKHASKHLTSLLT